MYGTKIGDIIAQGDVILRRIGELPVSRTKPKSVPRDRGCVVLAYGEVTGHAHAIAEKAVDQLEIDGSRYLVVDELIALIHGTLPGNGRVEALTDVEHNTIPCVPGNYEVIGQRTYAWGESTRVSD